MRQEWKRYKENEERNTKKKWQELHERSTLKHFFPFLDFTTKYGSDFDDRLFLRGNFYKINFDKIE